MKCKKCGFEWTPHGETMCCPSCATGNALTHSERQALWDKVYSAEKIKDRALRASSLLRLAEQGDVKAAFLYAECLYGGDGVGVNHEEALLWYKAAAGKMHPTAAYRFASYLKEQRFGNNQSQVVFWMRVAAEFGDPNAALELYRIYENGEGVEVSHHRALLWLVRGAEEGNPTCAYQLAKMYAAGNGVEKNVEVARYFAQMVPSPTLMQKLFFYTLGKGESRVPTEIDDKSSLKESLALAERAEAEAEHDIAAKIYYLGALKGDPDANYALGCCYETGSGVPKSESEARHHFSLAAAKGNAKAYLKIGDYAKEGMGGDVDPALALSSYERAAELGDAQACFRLAEAYRNGTICDASLPEALRYYEKAAALGYEGAKGEVEKIHAAISVVYEKGLAADREGDYGKSIHFFALAAGMGHAGASYLLGTMYEEGRGTAVDMKKAASHFRYAAQNGNLAAIYRLGVCYSEGRGVVCDYAVANSLLGVAAKQNYANAKEILEKLRRRKHLKAAQKVYSISSVLYRRGEVTEAIRFRMMAAKLGNARAMFMLGCHFEFGDGLPMDREKAAAWYTRAQRAGFRSGAGSDPKGGFLRARKALLLSKRRSTQ